jgi:hypothetical protein
MDAISFAAWLAHLWVRSQPDSITLFDLIAQTLNVIGAAGFF